MSAFILKFSMTLVGALILVERLRGGRRITVAYIRETIFVLLSAFAFSAVGFGVYALVSPVARAAGPAGWAALVVFILSYVGFAGLTLARLAPKAKPLPRWISGKPGWLDGAAVAGAGLALAAIGYLVAFGSVQ